MSLSDTDNEGFKAIDVGALDNFENEVSKRTEETQPDFDRFKLLFEPDEGEPKEAVDFESLHMTPEEKRKDPFQPLIEDPEEPEPEPARAEPENGRVEEDQPDPMAVLQEQAWEQGYNEGYEKGFESGNHKGFEEGFAKGETEGLARGEAEGFAKGEAEGFAKGEAEGREAGEKAAADEAVPRLATLSQSLISVESVLEDLVAAHEKEILELVFTVVRKVIAASLDTDDEIVRHTILDALKGLAIPRKIELNVSPEDYDYIEMIKDSFFEAMESLEYVAIKSDPMVERGGCRIDTATASVATDPEAKLEAVYQAVVRAKGK